MSRLEALDTGEDCVQGYYYFYSMGGRGRGGGMGGGLNSCVRSTPVRDLGLKTEQTSASSCHDINNNKTFIFFLPRVCLDPTSIKLKS